MATEDYKELRDVSAAAGEVASQITKALQTQAPQFAKILSGITTQLEKHGLVVDEESEGIKARYRNGARRTAGKLV